MYALARIGDQQAGPVLMAVARRDPLFTRSGVLALGELRYEPAIPLLVEFVHSASDPLVRSMAAAVLKNDFGRDEGVETLWPLLLSDDEKEFGLAWNVVIRIREKYRDAAFLDKLVKAMTAQTDPSRLVGLMLGLINADDGSHQAACFLYSLLDDEREAREYFSQGREAAVGDFAAYYLAHLLRGEISLSGVVGKGLSLSKEARQKFQETVKREAAKILFAQ
jgi:HEAT repeat protein